MSPGEDGALRPLLVGREYFKAHGLGNDYLVFAGTSDPDIGWTVAAPSVRRLCDRHEGVGADGIVILLDREPEDGVFPLRMFNPDGSEFERSGNGLRILAGALFRAGLVGGDPFRVRTGGDEIQMTVHSRSDEGVYDISVEMGQAGVGTAIELNALALDSEGRAVHPLLGPVSFVPVTVGNPHAVVFREVSDEADLESLGPFLTTHPAFPAGTNVQIATVVGPRRLRILIWERGVGKTSASGTSSCASAVAAVFTGRLSPGLIQVEMSGGQLQVEVGGELEVVLRGPVTEVAEGKLTEGFCSALGS